MTEMETVRAASTVVRVARAVTIEIEMVRGVDSAAHRLARITRTATEIIMARADVQASTVADKVARAVSTAVVREARVALTVAARADREALDLAQAEWAEQLQYLLLISLASQLRKHLKAKNRYITARTKSSTMIISLDRRRRLKLQLL